MPGRDEQAVLDEGSDSHLAAKTSLNPSRGFRGIVFIWLSLKDSRVLHFPPSLANPPSGFICLKIAQEETTLLLFYTKPSEVEIARGNLSICYPSAQQWMEFITLCILPPASARQPVGWSMGGEGDLGLREGAIALRLLYKPIYLRQKYKPIYLRARVGQSHNGSRQEAERCRCWTESNLASHKPLATPLHAVSQPGGKSKGKLWEA